MDYDLPDHIEDESQFWHELDTIICLPVSTQESIAALVEHFLTFVANFGPDYLESDVDVESCCQKLLDSEPFDLYPDYFRTALLAFGVDSDELARKFVNVYLLLMDGRRNSRTFKLMKRADLICGIADMAKCHHDESPRFMRLAFTTLHEICRIQKLPENDLMFFDEEYIWFLMRCVELARDDEDPYSYKSIKVIVSLNEQFMVATLPLTQQPFPKSPSNTSLSLAENANADISKITAPKNSILKVLSSHGARFKAFGENLIRMLNRERETSLQLLILKQLFLLFTNPATYEYFYTNDLYVLVDVFIRELYDLPSDDEALRHTYLRVLHPLLTHTQLRNPPYYKAPELVKLLTSLNQECSHFGPVGSTTVRLLARCLTVPWLLPPKKRKIRLPVPSFPERRKSDKAPPLGISLKEEEQSSKLSIHSIDSVNSIAKVRPPTSPRIKSGSVRKSRHHLPPLVEGNTAQRKKSDAPPYQPNNESHEKEMEAKVAHLASEMSKLQATV